jgi:hypothetical protein
MAERRLRDWIERILSFAAAVAGQRTCAGLGLQAGFGYIGAVPVRAATDCTPRKTHMATNSVERLCTGDRIRLTMDDVVTAIAPDQSWLQVQYSRYQRLLITDPSLVGIQLDLAARIADSQAHDEREAQQLRAGQIALTDDHFYYLMGDLQDVYLARGAPEGADFLFALARYNPRVDDESVLLLRSAALLVLPDGALCYVVEGRRTSCADGARSAAVGTS